MDTLNRRLTRRQIAAFIKDAEGNPDHRGIVTFENLQEDVTGTAAVIAAAPFVVTEADDNLGAARTLTGSSNVSVDDGGAGTDVTLDLTDTGVSAGTYGQPTRILVLAITAQGRVTSAQEIKLDVSDVDGTLAVAHGGTGLTSYAVGDLIVATGATTLTSLPDVAVGSVLKSGGVGVAPAYGQVDLTTDVTGTLPAGNGGFPSGGFTGSGTYTNFTFADGLCTSAS